MRSSLLGPLDPHLYYHFSLEHPTSKDLHADPGLETPPLTMVGSIKILLTLSRDAPCVYDLGFAQSRCSPALLLSFAASHFL